MEVTSNILDISDENHNEKDYTEKFIIQLKEQLEKSNRENKELYEKYESLVKAINKKKSQILKCRNSLISLLDNVTVIDNNNINDNSIDIINNNNINNNNGYSNNYSNLTIVEKLSNSSSTSTPTILSRSPSPETITTNSTPLKKNKPIIFHENTIDFFQNKKKINNNTEHNDDTQIRNVNYNILKNDNNQINNNNNNNNNINNNNGKRKYSSEDESEEDVNFCQNGERDLKKQKRTIWTEQEEELFKNVYQQYGRNWKLIHSHFQSKTLMQVSTHAKYLIKIGKLENIPRIKIDQSFKNIDDNSNNNNIDINNSIINNNLNSDEMNNIIISS
ncbi:hypothetical protein DICPUDRAFT_79707 [Dictyostelium purpureum]|uniref:Uncharacterized protein n=1 Tax=Dictyostelium purpureum TaxID=5786 RepID=F0ZND7_DICPU|nr:uncharacterized protein DICPUDRAFT_79707 [Dictyostelium purpureum]EGC34545.1 hypothetical protein DICPUDRAFT_79707 [Dictyostelium purpureum]|eukprot:XP_003288921.1 hypothetical protein DICPUDRAFT_79707 [Dictyostelium purpureum]